MSSYLSKRLPPKTWNPLSPLGRRAEGGSKEVRGERAYKYDCDVPIYTVYMYMFSHEFNFSDEIMK